MLHPLMRSLRTQRFRFMAGATEFAQKKISNGLGRNQLYLLYKVDTLMYFQPVFVDLALVS